MSEFENLATTFQVTQDALLRHSARAVDSALVVRNWLFGWYLVEFENASASRADLYGKELINKLAKRLKEKGLQGISPTNLRKFREFFQAYREIQRATSVTSLAGLGSPSFLQDSASTEKIQQTLSVESFQSMRQAAFTQIASSLPLGWSHYVELLTLEDPSERSFYEIEAASNQWSVRELQRQIASSLYQRLALSRDTNEIHRLAVEGQVVEKAVDLIKNPIVLEFLGLQDRPHYSEDELESAIINQLESFLLELGKGFLFEARQKRFTFDNDHFRVDLVFYNRLLRCYVLVDLKRDKLTHQDLGQMQMYVNYFDRHVKLSEELPTIGILLCHRKNDALVELTLPPNANIFASKYQLYLPSKEELKAQLEIITTNLEEARHGL
ncbi:MAG: PDDEXK nuclease domain-containing protein [Limisphaerales bacterium]